MRELHHSCRTARTISGEVTMTGLGFTCDELQALAEKWSDEGLWNDILWLSLQFWEASDESERTMRWHHLVMAVGNFKRQAGRGLHPPRIAPAELSTFRPRSKTLEIPGAGFRLAREALPSWSQLQHFLPGAGVPTTTTLLAALWPDRHHILDWRVLAAAVALTLGTPGPGQLVQPTEERSVPPTMEAYDLTRVLLLGVADECHVPLVTVERALYQLTLPVTGKGRNWQQYADALRRQLPRPASSDRSGGDPNDEQDIPPAAP
jgi:hypothetical protein